ncbi:MAG: HD domain-containing protein [Solirubrobacteraceae bacterium]
MCITVAGWHALPPIDDPLELIRGALAGRRAWLVGGAVRDRLLGRPTGDLDVVLDGEPREAARALANMARAAAFSLSEEYGGWRVVARDGAWQVDFERLRGASLEEDLALRDFTVNAIAEPLGEPGARVERVSTESVPVSTEAGGHGPKARIPVSTEAGGHGPKARIPVSTEAGGHGPKARIPVSASELIDPLGGAEDLARRRLRETGPRAFADDPLRVLRLVRLAVELDLEADADTCAHARARAAALGEVAPERIFMELSRIIDAPRAVAGLELMTEVGATAVVLPELEALRGVTQSHYHHLDVYGHTLEVLQQVIALQEEPAAARGGWGDLGLGRGGDLYREAIAGLLAEPLADGLTRGGALRWGALLHDAAKPLTREVRPTDGRVTFIGHDARGAQLAGEVLAGLRASARLQTHVAALVRNHLRLGFLVHDPQPLARRTVFAYLRASEPVEVDVTLLSVADRLATRGERSREAIEAHLDLARGMLADAIGWRVEGGPPRPLLRGDELARELGIAAGPRLGQLLEELLRAQYAGEVSTREEALMLLREGLGAQDERMRGPLGGQ